MLDAGEIVHVNRLIQDSMMNLRNSLRKEFQEKADRLEAIIAAERAHSLNQTRRIEQLEQKVAALGSAVNALGGSVR